jgi:hypothetical protein
MEDYKRDGFDLGFEAGVRRMATKMRNYIITNMNLSGGANLKIGDVEKMKREILKSWEEMVNE